MSKVRTTAGESEPVKVPTCGQVATKMFKLKLHETMQVSDGTWLMRVPGGWLYSNVGLKQMVFVQENPEFLDDSMWGDRDTVKMLNQHKLTDDELAQVMLKVKKEEAMCVLGETEDPFARCKTCG